MERSNHSRVARAVGGHARVVRCCLPSERQVRRHHVCLIRHRDPTRDRNLEPASPAEVAARDSGNGFVDESFGAADVSNDVGLRRDESRVDRERLAASAR